jgi:hypothetical protein
LSVRFVCVPLVLVGVCALTLLRLMINRNSGKPIPIISYAYALSIGGLTGATGMRLPASLLAPYDGKLGVQGCQNLNAPSSGSTVSTHENITSRLFLFAQELQLKCAPTPI